MIDAVRSAARTTLPGRYAAGCANCGVTIRRADPADRRPSTRAELLLLSPSFLVPCLTHGPIKVWDAFAIAEYLNDIKPRARIVAADRAAAAHCRSVCGEMHTGFSNLRSALPMNLKAHHPGFRVWPGAQSDIDRVTTIWANASPLWRSVPVWAPSMADAMYLGSSPLPQL